MKWTDLKKQIEKAIANPKSGFSKYDLEEALSLLIRERFMARVPHSEFNDSIILKGGLLLTLVYTKSSRYTGDADIALRNAYELSDHQRAIDSMLAADLEDGFSFSRNQGKILSNEQREYDGAQFNITCVFDGKQRTQFILDIGIGDAVKPISAKLPTLSDFETTSLEMQVYPPETIAAEKYHAIISFGGRNTRFKDFYDLYILRDYVDPKKFSEAVKQTFKRRKTKLIEKIPLEAPVVKRMQLQWEGFLASKQYRVIKKVPKNFQDVLNAITEFYFEVER